MKDPFPPARVAGILALSATQQYYQLTDIANRILPSICPLTFDPEKQVINWFQADSPNHTYSMLSHLFSLLITMM